MLASPAATHRALVQTRAAGHAYAVVPLPEACEVLTTEGDLCSCGRCRRGSPGLVGPMPRAERVTDPDAELHVAGACCLGWPFPGAIIMCLLDIGHDGPCGWERWNEVDVAMLADQVDPVRRIERRAAFHRGARTWAHDGG